MTFVEFFKQQLEEEAVTTRKMLACIPDDKYDWKPHVKSMSVRSLASHIAELPSWVAMVFTTDELDFEANPYQLPVIDSTKDLLAYFEQNLANGLAHLKPEFEADMNKPWTLRSGETIHNTSSKRDVVRMTMSQIIHHRAQLGVFLRLLNIPIPGSYGPSADEMNF